MGHTACGNASFPAAVRRREGAHTVRFRTTLPATLQGMKKYLGSGLVKGIGPVMAERIVEAFGEATFTVIDTDPLLLQEVAGIGPVRATRIAATWAEQRHVREVMAALQGFGMMPTAGAIFQVWWDAVPDVCSPPAHQAGLG